MREKLCLDKGWKFLLGDPKPEKPVGHQAIYMASKAERGRGVAAKDFYDAEWEDITLPHDFVVKGEYDKKADGNHGCLHRPNAWYRRSFTLTEEDEDKRVSLIFDGIATHSTIWVNGHLLERNFCGYNAINIDITDVLRPTGEVNVIAVRVDNSEFEGWWYEGGGIYRHVWLLKTHKIAVKTWGTHVNPIKKENNWCVNIETIINNAAYLNEIVMVEHRIVDAENRVVQSVNESIQLNNQCEYVSKLSTAVDNPVNWTLELPYLYGVETQIIHNGVVVDVYNTTFGFRTLRFDANEGFFLNDKNMKIKGVCGHQDHGGLGVAVPEQVWELRIKKLKAMGCNAYRCGHTPPSTEFLDLCDKYGLLVMDESRWFETSRIGLLQVENMVRKDRNHPCVFIWSVGNEEPLQSTDVGGKIATHLKQFVKQFDTTRPVTVALNGGFYDSKVSRASDLVGVNYNYRAYDTIHELLPNHPIFAPEAATSISTRNVYFDDEKNRHNIAYDEKHAPFGSTHRKAWGEVAKRDFIMGLFYWCGFEYRGEKQWPTLFSSGGAFDSSGYEKDTYYLLQAFWSDEPMVHVLPHWNLDVKEGTPIKVMTYTNGDEVELVLNNTSLGKKINDPIYQTEWEVPYQKGCLEAIAYKNGEEIARKETYTMEGPYQLNINTQDTGNQSKENNIYMFDITLCDTNGNVATHLDSDMTFELEGLTLLGTGNGNHTDHTPNCINRRDIFKGHCQVIARAVDDAVQGSITVKTQQYGEESKAVSFANLKLVDYMPSAKRNWKIEQWWKAPISQEPIDLSQPISENDVNTWEPISLMGHQFASGEGYHHYYVSTKMPSFNSDERTAYIQLNGIDGNIMFKIEHKKDYWPLPEPKAFLSVDKEFTNKAEKELIKLDGFNKDEAVLIQIVAKTTGETTSTLESIEWILV